MHYYSRHVGDYLRDTSHLSLMEHGIYGRLLDLYYINEGPLEDETLVRVVGARTDDERKALEAVLNDFFDLSGGKWSQARCDKEIAAYRLMVDGGKRGAAKRWGKGGDTPPIAPPMLTINQEPITNKEKKPRKAANTPLSPDFQISERVKEWAAAGGHRNLQAHFDALVSYAKRKGATYADWDEALMEAVRKDWGKTGLKLVDDRFAGAI